MRAPSGVALLAVLAALAAAPSRAETEAPAEDPAQRLDETERALDAARTREQMFRADRDALTRELTALRAESVELAATIVRTEAQVATLGAARDVTATEAAERRAALDSRRERLADLLAGLARLARTPPEAVALRPGAPIDAARAGRLLAGAVPALEAEAARLGRDLVALAAAAAKLTEEESSLAEARARLAEESIRLASLIDRRRALVRETERTRTEAQARADSLAREAADLRELVARLAAEREIRARQEREQAVLAPMTGASGKLRAPVPGQVLRSWGQPGAGGLPQRGLTFLAPRDATVVAPWDGVVAFAGAFRGYGLILILEHGDGYHSLIAGLGRLDVALGQPVSAGEPVARAGAAEGGAPAVYLELRRNGQPIDPMPWLAAPNGKVSG